MAIEILLGDTQKNGANIIINITELSQFRGKLKTEEGSNTENRLVSIIFMEN